MSQHLTPSFTCEVRLWRQGFLRIAGVDEAGRGALAGPVVAAALIAPPHSELSGVWSAVRDSKQLSPVRRTHLAEMIRQQALAWGVGEVPAAEIDRIGIAPATRLAMSQAIAQLSPAPDYLLIDWVRLPQINLRQESTAKADALIVSVAAASILAKVHRDQLMVRLAAEYPDFHFADNKGYGSAAHLAAIERHGACPIHRCSFAPLASQQTLFDARDI